MSSNLYVTLLFLFQSSPTNKKFQTERLNLTQTSAFKKTTIIKPINVGRNRNPFYLVKPRYIQKVIHENMIKKDHKILFDSTVDTKFNFIVNDINIQIN